MKKLGRPPKDIKLTEVKIRLTDETRATLDLLCLDPLTSRLEYGKRNELIEHALIEYFGKHYTRKEKRKVVSGLIPKADEKEN